MLKLTRLMSSSSQQQQPPQGSFAESIQTNINETNNNDCDYDCDASSCSSSSSGEDECESSSSSSPTSSSSKHLNAHAGSFPSSCPSMENASLGVVSMPLPIVFEEEDECETIVSNIEDEEQEREQSQEQESLQLDEDGQEIIPNPEDEDDSEEEHEREPCAKTVCSNTDATCQTIPISLSQDSTISANTESASVSASVTSIDHTHPTIQNFEEELDSRLNAILALKEVVFAQRMAMKESTKDKLRLSSKLANKNKLNKQMCSRNRHLEKELALVKEQLRVATSKLLLIEEDNEEEEKEEVVEKESIFDVLHRINEARKSECDC
jgi:hypothetical protein